MAKLSYVISKNVRRAGKSGFHFDGNGSGNWFQNLFNSKKGETELAPEKAEIKDLISKLVTEFDGNSESVKETRFEVEGSCEEIKEFAAWSIGEIKANAESLKHVADFAKDYCESIGNMSVKIYRGMTDAEKVETERDQLQTEVEKLKGELAAKAKKTEK